MQGHCHHKAIMRLYDEEAVMKKMGLDYQVLDSGCCGMAGAFGYEKDKYEVSIACGERKLLPEGAFRRDHDLDHGRRLQLQGADRAADAASRAAPGRSDGDGHSQRRQGDAAKTIPSARLCSHAFRRRRRSMRRAADPDRCGSRRICRGLLARAQNGTLNSAFPHLKTAIKSG